MSFETGTTSEVSNISRAVIAAVDEIRQERLTGRVYCSRKKIWTTRGECLSRYKQARATGKNWGETCLECARVRHWAKEEAENVKSIFETKFIPPPSNLVEKEEQDPKKAKARPKPEPKPEPKPKPTRSKPVKKASVESVATLTLDFSGYPELIEGLKVSAHDHFRTPDEQILYLIKNHLDGRKWKAADGQ
jgi:hypothetical protein